MRVTEVGPYMYFITTDGKDYLLQAYSKAGGGNQYVVVLEQIETDKEQIEVIETLYEIDFFDRNGMLLRSIISDILKTIEKVGLKNPYLLCTNIGGRVRGKQPTVPPVQLSLYH